MINFTLISEIKHCIKYEDKGSETLLRIQHYWSIMEQNQSVNGLRPKDPSIAKYFDLTCRNWILLILAKKITRSSQISRNLALKYLDEQLA